MKSFTIIVFCLASVYAQDTGTLTERGIVDTWFLAQRPASPAGRAALAPERLSLIGITLWKVRMPPVRERGPMAARIFTHPQTGDRWIAERVSVDQLITQGERVRIGIESPRPGHLYVIDRQQYRGGRQGRPYLIFPSSAILNGRTEVGPGALVEIPGADDRPPYFVVQDSGEESSDYEGEVLTLMVLPQPIPALRAVSEPLLLDDAQVARWERQYTATTVRYGRPETVGEAQTPAEMEAGTMAARLLTHTEPAPQDIYAVAVKPGAPYAVQIHLAVAPARRP
jgi:hypothetical protein